MTIKADLCVIGDSGAGRQIALAAAALGGRSVLVIDEPEAGLDGDVADRALALLLAAGRAPLHAVTSPALLLEEARRQFAGMSIGVLGARGVRVLRGAARFEDSRTLRCGNDTIRARHYVVAPVAGPVMPEGLDLADLDTLTPETFFTLDSVPTRLVVLGGSATAVEFAEAVALLTGGCTLIAQGEILAGHDPEAVALIRRGLNQHGIALHENTSITGLRALTSGLTLDASGPDGTLMLNAGHLLVVPEYRARASRDLLAAAGATLDADGAVLDPRLRTSNRAIRVVGQRRGGGLTNPAAALEAAHAIRATMVGMAGAFDGTATPRPVRTTPGLVAIGAAEGEARRSGAGVRVYRAPLASVAGQAGSGQAGGFFKIAASGSGRILGAVIAGADAGALAAPVALAMANGMPLQRVARMSLPPGDRAEALREIALIDLARRLSTPMARRLSRMLRLFA